MKHPLTLITALAAAGCAFLTASLTPAPDGTEQLGPPVGIPVASGTDFLLAGTGLGGMQPGGAVPGTIQLEVPAGVTIKQVLLYWEGHALSAAEQGVTDTITLNGTKVITGQRIGGPTHFFTTGFGEAWSSSYRADITAENLIAVGPNSLGVSGTDFGLANNGAGIVVIVEDPTQSADLDLQDGNDNAYAGFAPPLNTTYPVAFGLTNSARAPVKFSFTPSADDRMAKFGLFTGSAQVARPSIIVFRINGVMADVVIDELDNGDGDDWDTVVHNLLVPANATTVSVQLLSMDSGSGPYAGGNPVSVTWVTAAFAIEAESCTGRIGDFVWNDVNGNGLQDPDEAGLEGVHVMLMDGSGSVALDSTATNADGYYYFEGVCPGRYQVVVDETTIPPEFVSSPCNVGDDDTIDSDCSPALVILPPNAAENLTIDFGYTVPPGGGEGCTPGYWKQAQHFDSWPAGYDPSDLFSDHFEDAFPGKTLLQVLWQGGGGLKALGRHTVAALLNAESDGVGYDLTPSEVVTMFNDVFPGSKPDYTDLKDLFVGYNESGCPLN